YSQSAQSNPSGPTSGSNRVLRGGSWNCVADYCRSAFRSHYGPGFRGGSLGFRVARTDPWPSDTFTLAAQQAAQAQRPARETPEPPKYTPYHVFRDQEKLPALVYLPGGRFNMGDSQGIGGDDEKPVHEVTLDAFALGCTPVTVGDYLRFVEATDQHAPEWLEEGSQYHIDTGTDDHYSKAGVSRENLDHPIVGVSWDDAQAYCDWLSEQTGEQYTLPTEAEWEYACRSGSEAAYCFGDDESELADYAWYGENSQNKTQPIGTRKANAWGLYDMHGNVWEWVYDWYESYSQSAQSNPSGPAEGSNRVFRGGGWINDADYCRSAVRGRSDPGGRSSGLGFRVARRV
ncbi:MAG: SUMF1/EgtB/PvdO family nonheme iron enzyme, partial [Candidatus Competibacteraceae bacterium]|nr:SUMF1/EgtB/PvdO family nonheme iron enzyme [Candidatus Competibacteraceae bacterium]